MSAKKLEGVVWYVDERARGAGEPGMRHSYVASLATALDYCTDEFDPVWLMGCSAFAFRLFVAEAMCPSAMSVFGFSEILPEAVEQAGRRCTYVSRYWHEGEREEERRLQAHAAIVDGIDRGMPAVVWDVADCEWGLIIGYDDEKAHYDTLTCHGTPSSLPLQRLGRNGIDILSVTIPGEPNERTREEIVRNSLNAAVAHAEQREFMMERPKYQDGLPAYDLWALLYDRLALIVGAGRSHRIAVDVRSSAEYYASVHYGARCYARDYLSAIAQGNGALEKAASRYAEVATHLRPVWEHSQASEPPAPESLSLMAEAITRAKAAEEEGVQAIRKYLAQDSPR
jgi:hypothetical protein